MTAATATRIPCPVDGCSYTVDSPGSIPAHVAMAHPDTPIATVSPKRSARNAPTTSPEPATGPVPSLQAAPEPAPAVLREIPLDLVDVGSNVRVDVAELEELTSSIQEHGVLQPVKVFEDLTGRYRLVWGQRRTLAARHAGLMTIPAIVQPFAESTAGANRSIEQLVENLHRADLNPIDRAQAMRAVVDSGISQADLARKLGIAPSTVANDLRILTLDDKVVDAVRSGQVTASHAKSMVSLSPKHQQELASRIAGGNLSAHQLESELQWRRQSVEADEARRKRTEKAIPKVLAALEAAKVNKDVAVQLRGAYNLESAPVERAIEGAGWKLDRGYAWPKPEKGKCDCTVVVLEFDRTWKVTPSCTDDKHRDRARNLSQVEDKKRREEQAAKAAELRARIRPLLEEVPLPVLVLIYGDNWGMADLVAKAAAPDYDVAALRDEAAGRLVGRVDPSQVRNDRNTPLEAALDTLLGLLPVAEAAS